jgi:hypothetical protein
MLTRTQREIALKIYQSLQAREVVQLTGIRNGKTYSMSRLIDHCYTYESGAVLKPVLQRSQIGHSEDRKIAIIEHVAFPTRGDRCSVENLMRQILRAAGHKLHPHNCDAYTVRHDFMTILYDLTNAGYTMCLAIDNAELYPERIYTVLKEINELRYRGKNIGMGIVMSGLYEKMKTPYWWNELAVEIPVAKINGVDEIQQFLQTHYPAEAHLFKPSAIKQLQRAATTGIMRRSARVLVEDIRAEVSREIDELELGKEVDKLNKKYLAVA